MGGQTKNLDFAEVHAYLKDSQHVLYLIGQEGDGLFNQLGDLGRLFPSLEDAFEQATLSAKSGEAILLAPGCASAYPFPNFRERGEAFKKMAQAWLQGPSPRGFDVN